MLIMGCDYHPSVQQIALVDTETGECQARRLAHRAEAEHFYRELRQPGVSVRVRIEATGHSRWFERLLAELNFDLWAGDWISYWRQSPPRSLLSDIDRVGIGLGF